LQKIPNIKNILKQNKIESPESLMEPFYELYFQRFLKKSNELLDKVKQGDNTTPYFKELNSAQVYNFIKLLIF
jgi:hypothetical protein